VPRRDQVVGPFLDAEDRELEQCCTPAVRAALAMI